MSEMRVRAENSLNKAKKLISKDDDDSVRYGCLELRFAIEYLCYAHLYGYLDELPKEVAKKWTPKQVIREMLSIDPHADQSSIITIGEDVPDQEQSTKFSGTNNVLKLSWANRNHNALSSFLHAPTIYQMESGVLSNIDTMKSKASSVITEVERILSSSIIHFNFGNFHNFECQYCGKKIKRRDGSFNEEAGIVCPSCSAIHDVQKQEDGKTTVRMRQTSFECQYCGGKVPVGAHLLKEGTSLLCECGQGFRVVLGVMPSHQNGGAGT
jgi:DNA-directed RNA polymerase subunit RPC12/RpoP